MPVRWRSNSARRLREKVLAADPGPGPASGFDDSLELLFLCCHPSLTLPSQIAAPRGGWPNDRPGRCRGGRHLPVLHRGAHRVFRHFAGPSYLADEAVRLGRLLLTLVRAHPALARQEAEVAGLLALDTAAADPTIADHHRTHSVPERQHLLRRAARLA